jgi:uncharacterized protein (UPF0332 family)
MTTWDDLAQDNTLAANETFDKHRWRTCISRAYYAAYSAVTQQLVAQGVTMPKSQQNPHHASLPNLVAHNLNTLAHPVRLQLAGAIAKLYNLRIIADYVPQMPVEERDARLALGLMEHAFRCIRGKS